MASTCVYHLNPHDRPLVKIDRNFNKRFRNADPQAYHQHIRGYAPTPLISLNRLAKSLGIKELYLKDESKRFKQSTFKTLGASYAMQTYLREHPGRHTFCSATDGNHGRAIAWAARKHKQKAVVYVPAYTAAARIKNIRKNRGRVVVVEGDYDETVARAREDAEKLGYVLLQDTAWEGYTEIPTLIGAGYQTMLEELEELLHTASGPNVDFVVLQAGVGTFAASVVAWYRNRFRQKMPFMIAVEPLASDALIESIRQNSLSKTRGSQDTLMAGLNCGTPSSIAWNILKDGIDLFLSIPDEYAVKAMQYLYYPFKNDTQIFAGESGAAGLGGLIALTQEDGLEEVREAIGLNEKSRVLVFNTEGVTDPDLFDELISREVEV